MTPKEEIEYHKIKGLIIATLAEHIGEPNAVGMGDLYESVFGVPWTHRINDTRKVRKYITHLRRDGVPICSTARKDGGGYYLPAGSSELVNYLRRSKVRALKILSRVAKIQRVSLPELLGQMRLELEGNHGETA
ncbi:MAG TPA: hypothetical protein P5308_05185 [Syntrophales bacterium]|nr:hypothetical protein [Syntrophales bacterium]